MIPCRRARSLFAAVVLMVTVAAVGAAETATAAPPGLGRSAGRTVLPMAASVLGGGKIKHVVVIYQENHSFDNVLGRLCVADRRCDGATSGVLKSGQRIALRTAADLIPQVEHSTASHAASIDGGRMDGFSTISGCTGAESHRCYSQFDPSQIPNISGLARAYALSDRTFETGGPSFGGHIGIVSPTLDGYTGDNPAVKAGQGPGWGCDSHRDAPWRSSATSATIMVPACVPTPAGQGPYRSSPVRWVPNLMDRLDQAGRSWRIYGPTRTYGTSAYGWAICPIFADCLLGSHAGNQVPRPQVLTDAAAGQLPAFSVVVPTGGVSQHNLSSMREGDNWIGQVMTALERSPNWSSTAVFITYDDCGCFYDHVPPPAGQGIRVPMVIASPYARHAYTDHTTAGFPSIMAFTEHVFGLTALGAKDANAYDYGNAFNFTQAPLGTVAMTRSPIPRSERRWLAAHPLQPDPT